MEKDLNKIFYKQLIAQECILKNIKYLVKDVKEFRKNVDDNLLAMTNELKAIKSEIEKLDTDLKAKATDIIGAIDEVLESIDKVLVAEGKNLNQLNDIYMKVVEIYPYAMAIDFNISSNLGMLRDQNNKLFSMIKSEFDETQNILNNFATNVNEQQNKIKDLVSSIQGQSFQMLNSVTGEIPMILRENHITLTEQLNTLNKNITDRVDATDTKNDAIELKNAEARNNLSLIESKSDSVLNLLHTNVKKNKQYVKFIENEVITLSSVMSFEFVLVVGKCTIKSKGHDMTYPIYGEEGLKIISEKFYTENSNESITVDVQGKIYAIINPY